MKFWRSYGGISSLAWICALVFVASITDASLTDSELAARLAYGLAAVAVVDFGAMAIISPEEYEAAGLRVRSQSLRYHPAHRHSRHWRSRIPSCWRMPSPCIVAQKEEES